MRASIAMRAARLTRSGARRPGQGSPLPRTRAFSSKPSTSSRGPVSYASLGLTLATGAGLAMWWDSQQKERQAKSAEASGGQGQAIGAAAIGGPFELTESRTGRPFTERDLLGRWNLLYFGFTTCPDICPDELEKIALAVDAVNAAPGAGGGEGAVPGPSPAPAARALRPIFLTIDPARDTAERVREYVAEFHPAMLGLVGSDEACRRAARSYRVYYSKTNDSGDDYLVDHSIISYLVDPEGRFVAFYGKNVAADEMAASILGHMRAAEA